MNMLLPSPQVCRGRLQSLARSTLAAVVGMLITASSGAEPLLVKSYDVQQTPISGWGCWFHAYTGTVTDTGRRVSSAVWCGTDGNYLVNYAGGSGTLNDGVTSELTGDNHLFTNRLADDALPIQPVITLHLDGASTVNEVRVFGGDNFYNIFAGNLKSATVEIAGHSVAIPVTPAGTPNYWGVYPEGVLDLRGTELATLPTTTVVLREPITGLFFGFPLDQFSLTEISVDGLPASLVVEIDVAGATERRLVPGSSQLARVAVRSTPSFDALAEVARPTLRFGKTGDEPTLDFCLDYGQDTDHDGLVDLVCFFRMSDTGLTSGDSLVVLKGSTTSGGLLRGEVAIRTGP